MSADTLGISWDDLFQPHGGKGHDRWQVLTTYTRIEEPISFCGRVWQPYIEDDFLPYQQKQSPVSSSPIIEDEETHHEFLPHIYGSGVQSSRDLCQTLSALQSWNTDVDQMRVRSLNWASGFNARQLNSSFQKLEVSSCNQLQDAEVSSSTCNPYAEYGRYSGHPLATHHKSFEPTPVSIMTKKSRTPENENPTDLSLPKYSMQNADSEGTADGNSFENTDVSQRTCYGRDEFPRLTYTHLSDVSDDSEEDLDENRNIPKRFNRGLAKKRFEKLRPYQLALPWIPTTYPIIERPSISTFDPVASYTQIVMSSPQDPAVASYINWLLHPIVHDMNDLTQKIPERKQEQKIIELEEDSVYKHNDVIHNVVGRHVMPAAEDNVIDLTQDDDEDGMGNEQLHVQPSPSNHNIQVDVATLEETIQQSTLSLQRPKFSVSTHTLTPTSYLESSTISVDSIISPEKDLPSSSQNTSAQQNYYFLSPMLEGHSDTVRDKYVSQHLTDASSTNLLPDTAHIQKRKKRPYRKRKAACYTAGCSGPKQPRRSPRIRSIAKESTCANVRRKEEARNHQAASQEAPCVAPSHPRRSPRLQRAAIKLAPATKKRSREPWDHKGLFRFVAQNAFKLPRYVWKQKDSGPRRSNRLAKKMQCNRYLLRARSHTKS